MPRILAWNVFHGRAEPPAGRELLDEYAAMLAGWAWDVALLQEVPPWWPVPLAERCRASMRMALTSRNWLLGLRAPLARRLPDLLKSEGGGCNAILVRGSRVLEHRRLELTLEPERRVVHGVRLQDGTWAANIHASKQEPRERTEADVRLAAAVVTHAWAGPGVPAILGGDFNMASPPAAPLERMAGGGVDHVYARGFSRVSAQALDAGRLSDHRPILVSLRKASGGQ
jgi:endonuclease/exonuclease/phosphatase family metal-dependent hydrolase